MKLFTFNYQDFYSSMDEIKDRLRVIKIFLDEREKASRKNNWITQADSIKQDLELLDEVKDLLFEIESNY